VDIIKRANETKDPLCMKVVEKFTEIFAVESANLALKTLPLSGLYLIGGVTNGIRNYILSTNTYLKNFQQKGRLESVMR
jgi:glucokinase